MPNLLIQALYDGTPTAPADATTWMANFNHNNPEDWLAYSKLIAAYLDKLGDFHQPSEADVNADAIARYYNEALHQLQKKPWNAAAFLEMHNSVECWPSIPDDVWAALHRQHWNPTALYEWSLENDPIQQRTLNTRAHAYNAEPLHVRMGAGLLHHCFNGQPLLADENIHWNLWTVFHGEEVYHTSKDLPRKIGLLAKATPGSFEHAITEFYQHAEKMFILKSCQHLLNMDMTKGEPFTTCSGLLLLYQTHRRHPQLFAKLDTTYPGLFSGFDVHLALYPDINDALLQAPALMPSWYRTVHGRPIQEPLALPSDLDDTV